MSVFLYNRCVNGIGEARVLKRVCNYKLETLFCIFDIGFSFNFSTTGTYITWVAYSWFDYKPPDSLTHSPIHSLAQSLTQSLTWA